MADEPEGETVKSKTLWVGVPAKHLTFIFFWLVRYKNKGTRKESWQQTLCQETRDQKTIDSHDHENLLSFDRGKRWQSICRLYFIKRGAPWDRCYHLMGSERR